MKSNLKMFVRRFKYIKNLVIIRTLSTNKKSLKSAKLIRTEFLEYFAKNNHAIVRSSPVVPLNDPSIPFVNAGMNQFKGVLLGDHSPPAFRVANSQKCIRVGGKHNDLDIVGNDSYHHTFFEMLGNWSFGDYFKEEACKYAWELLTEIYGIKKDFLYVTYFKGNEKLNLQPDLECKEIWLKIGVPKDHILPFGIEDNFWEMGPTGPCGPCTEIHIDHTMQSKNQASRVNKGHDDLTELWNVVFVQYQRLQNGRIIPLLKKHIDTGMGFERLVTVLQEKRSNYDTDIFQPLFEAIEKFTHAPKYQGRFGTADKNKIDTGYRILADHARMVTVALADGMLPDKNQKLRRILRKAIDISEESFKTSQLLSELTNHVAFSLGDVYPEIYKNLNKIQHIIQYEEEVMKSARNNAAKNWRKVVENRPELSAITDATLPGLTAGYYELQTFLKSEYKVNSLPGDFAYKLYDTYGLNSETICKLAEIESIPFDLKTFKEAIEKARERSRHKADKLNDEIISEYSLNLLESGNVPKTDDLLKYDYTITEKGYQFPVVKCKIVGMIMNGNLISEPETAFNVDESQTIVEATVTNSGNIVESSAVVTTNAEVGIILDKTPAYSTAGSQISDKGHIQIKDLLFNFEKVRKIRDYVIHIGHFVDWDEANPEHELQVGDECLISIDEKIRLGAMRHHTATHLLNASLQQILPVVGQRGSDVSKDFLNFECSVFGRKLSREDVVKIEKSINEVIAANVPVKTKTVDILQMLNEDNLTVVPGEVYPDTGIRIVEINSPALSSKEACCGTHVHKTGDLEHFCITSLKSLGSVSMSLKAITGPAARLARLAGDNLKDRILNIENDLKAGNATLKELEFRVNSEKQELLDKKKRTRFPYIVVQESLEKLELLSKNIRIRDRELTRNTIEEEIKKLLDSSSLPFVVHCLQPTNTSLENVSLKNIIKLCPPSTPVLVIVHCKSKVKASCFVPEKLQTDVFNAKTWMEEILQVFQSKGNVTKGDNPLISYNMQPIQISDSNFKILIDKAIATATKFASIYVDRSQKNKPNK
ncbi:alanine--tRNA ligase, mitochondrial [Nasonia vitripennis]|uniref:Alanine--tRNA ligase n=1 Tax=Nasonia vitripennis TaxID=7425 RepID=A0A7M7IZ57_NASVI|nr:alanine--tRNA ligase, mitochondrial [Nasonia vitripennis]